MIPSPLQRLYSRLEGASDRDGIFLLCSDCGDVHRVSTLDRAPVYAPDGSERTADDLQTFFSHHTEHALLWLHRSSDTEVHSHARHDPMGRVSWEATDEEHNSFVVSFSRENVESPRRYRVERGRLAVVSQSIEIDADLLRAVVDETLYPHAVPERKLGWLTDACRRRVRELPWESFDPIDEDRDDPNTQLACLPEAVAAPLAVEAASVFGAADGERLADLILSELRLEIPVVRLRRRYELRA